MSFWDTFFGNKKKKNIIETNINESASPNSIDKSENSLALQSTPNSPKPTGSDLWSRFFNKAEPVYKTSETHPLDLERLPQEILQRIEYHQASLGIHMCPGRNKKMWRRDLETDIQSLKNAKVDCVVTLVREVELDSMKLGSKRYFEILKENGFESYHFPIRDKFIPNDVNELCTTIDWIRIRLHEGKQVTVHCNGGKGRAGTITACLLVSCGIDPAESIRIVQSARGGSLRNPLQQLYIRKFKNAWESFKKQGRASVFSLPSLSSIESSPSSDVNIISKEDFVKDENILSSKSDSQTTQEKTLEIENLMAVISDIEVNGEENNTKESFNATLIDTETSERIYPQNELIEIIELDDNDS